MGNYFPVKKGLSRDSSFFSLFEIKKWFRESCVQTIYYPLSCISFFPKGVRGYTDILTDNDTLIISRYPREALTAALADVEQRVYAIISITQKLLTQVKPFTSATQSRISHRTTLVKIITTSHPCACLRARAQ